MNDGDAPDLLRQLAAPRAAMLLIVAAGALTFANSLPGVFVYDDIAWADEQRAPELFAFWEPNWSLAESLTEVTPFQGRPLALLVTAINYAVCDLRPAGYHLVNIVLHLGCGLMLFGVVRRTLLLPSLSERFGDGACPLALAVALIWLVHPLNVECVNYISQRTETLAGFFFLATFYCAIRDWRHERTSSWVALAVLCCALGLACKESVAVAPLLIPLFDFAYRDLPMRDVLRRRWPLYAGLVGTWAILASLMAWFPHKETIGLEHEITPWQYLLNQCLVITHYLQLAVWPTPLPLDYGPPREHSLADVWLPAALLVVLFALSLVGFATLPRLGFLGMWFFFLLAPTSSFIPIVTEVGADRRMYLPLIALVVFAVLTFHALFQQVFVAPRDAEVQKKRRLIAASALAIVCLPLILLSINGNRIYGSPARLWSAVAAVRPDAPRFRVFLARALEEADRPAEAADAYLAAAKLNPDDVDSRFRGATLLMTIGRRGEAIEQYRRVTAADPAHAPALNNLAVLLTDEHPDEAERLFARAVAARDDYARAYIGWGNLHARRGDFAKAIPYYQRAVKADASLLAAYLNLAECHAKLGDAPAAIDALNEGIAVAQNSGAAAEEEALRAKKQQIAAAPSPNCDPSPPQGP